jgi:hypothetical protein
VRAFCRPLRFHLESRTNIPLIFITYKLFDRTTGDTKSFKGCNGIVACLSNDGPTLTIQMMMSQPSTKHKQVNTKCRCARAGKEQEQSAGVARMAKDKLRLGG